ncbi:sigma-70 family RNA polymerase sigma factor [Pseudoneobacillus sp. C159]
MLSEEIEINQLNNEDTIEWLMNEYGRSVVRLAFTFLKKEQLAEDVAQEVFMKCYEKLDTFRHESSYKTWVYRITVNLCKDRLRSWSFRNLVLTEIFSKNSIYQKTPETELMNLEQKEELSKKVLALPIKYREVIILYYYEELPYSQMAELLDLSIPTIKSRLHRARILLKRMIEGGRNDG